MQYLSLDYPNEVQYARSNPGQYFKNHKSITYYDFYLDNWLSRIAKATPSIIMIVPYPTSRLLQRMYKHFSGLFVVITPSS
jgi:hypothetical protein